MEPAKLHRTLSAFHVAAMLSFALLDLASVPGVAGWAVLSGVAALAHLVRGAALAAR